MLGPWFVLEKVRGGDFDIEACWCDSKERYVPVPPEAQVFIAIDAMCMGWSWAAFFCRAGVVHLASKAFEGVDQQLLLERSPAPFIKPGKPAISIYIDNFLAFARSHNDARMAAEGFSRECEQRRVGLHADHVAVPVLEGLGLVDDGPRRLLLHNAHRN